MDGTEVIKIIRNYKQQISLAKASEDKNESTKSNLKLRLSQILNQISKLNGESLVTVSKEFHAMVTDTELDSYFDSEIIYTYIANHLVAFSLQINWHLDELSIQLSEIKKLIKKYLNLKNPHFFSFRSSFMFTKKQYLGKKAYLKLKFFLIYVETLLQHTAVLSQNGNHKEALEKASECFKTLKVYCVKLYTKKKRLLFFYLFIFFVYSFILQIVFSCDNNILGFVSSFFKNIRFNFNGWS